MNVMNESVFFGVALTLAVYRIGAAIKERWKFAILNPLLITVIVIMAILALFGMDYEVYRAGAQPVSYLLTPATVALAVPLYQKIELLKRHPSAILFGILSGALTSMGTVLALSAVFGLSHKEYVTLLPKSITTAIGLEVSEELGGIVPVTVAVIIVTGIVGNMIAEQVCRVFGITEPVAKGVGIGSAAHAVGTAKAMELGEAEGAMSSLSIAVSGLLTVVLAPLFAMLY